MTGLKPIKRNFKLCSATIGRWFCSSHTSSRDLHPTGGMHMLMHMRTAFHLHHVPQGIIKMKKKEFQYLKQGSMSVSECVTHFTQLSCYAPSDVDADEKKQNCFLNGLNDGLAHELEARDFENFRGMVNKALVLENRRGAMECKRKQERQHQASSNSRLRIGSSSGGPVFCPVQQQQQRP
jgi:hypothetical protein